LNKKLIFITTSIFTLFFQSIFASYTFYEFDHITTKTGLSHDCVTSIIQDDDGFMWFGTYNGLDRYDGNQVKTFSLNFNTTVKKRQQNSIRTLCKDHFGNIWIGTWRNGLNIYDPLTESLKHFHNKQDDTTSINGKIFRTIYKDKKNNLWFGSEDGLSKFNYKDSSFSNYTIPIDIFNLKTTKNPVSIIYEDKDQNLWIGTFKGLLVFDRKTNQFKIPQNSYIKPIYDLIKNPQVLFEDHKNNLWIGTWGHGLFRINRDTNINKHFNYNPENKTGLPNNIIHGIVQDHQKNILISTRGSGVCIFNPETQIFSQILVNPLNKNGLTNNITQPIYKDKSGIIWIGTLGGGINKYNSMEVVFSKIANIPTKKNTLVNNRVFCFSEDKYKNIWIGTGNGVDYFNPRENHWKHINIQPKIHRKILVRSILTDIEGSIWIGTIGNGVIKYYPKTEKYEFFTKDKNTLNSITSNNIYCLAESENSVWFGAQDGGLNRYDLQTKTIKQYLLCSPDVTRINDYTIKSLILNPNNKLWIGSHRRGLFCLDLKDNTLSNFTSYNKNDTIVDFGIISTISQIDENEFWIGTNQGLIKYNSITENGENFLSIKDHDFRIVQSVLEDKFNRVWTSTNDGLYCINFNNNNIVKYTKNEGLPNSTFLINSKLKTSDDHLWFGTPDGFFFFNPGKILENKNVPAVKFTGLELFNKPVIIGKKYKNDIVLKQSITHTKKLELSHDNNMLKIYFSALDFVDPQKNQFAYKMEGLDDKWHKINHQNSLFFSELQPGNYTFHVIASNNVNLWNEKGQILEIKIRYPWWKTPLFISILSIGLLLIIFLIIQLRTRSIRNRNIELDQYNKTLSKEIKERRKAEETALNSEQALRQVIDMIPFPVYAKDKNGCFIFANSYVADDFGLPIEKIIGENHTNIAPDKEQVAKMLQYDKQVIEKGITLNFPEDKYIKKDGTERWVWTIKLPFLYKLTKEQSVFGISIDITERKKIEEDLKKAQNYIKNIIDSMSSIIIGVDINLHITQWNKSAITFTSITPDEAYGKHLSEVLPILDFENSFIFQSVKNNEIQHIQKKITIDKTSTSYKDITIFPLKEDNISGAVIRIDDITEKVMLEQMMIQSEKMLSIGGLAAGMAHEINNPLAGILQNIQVLENRLLKKLPGNEKSAQEHDIDIEKLQKYFNDRHIESIIKQINKSGQRAADIVKNMLSFARKEDYKKVEVDITKIVDDTLELVLNDYDLKKKYDFRKIEIQKYYNLTNTKILCSPTQIQQVLLNILKNGAEAMNENNDSSKKPKFIIDISCEANWIVVKIEDNGPGMNTNTKKRILEPFYTTKPVGKGTGLGLSVSYFIITENHQGKLIVKSEIGQGTTFIIQLPALQ